MPAAQLLIETGKSDEDVIKKILSKLVKANNIGKKKHEAKILFTNQRPPAERGPGPFKGPSLYSQLCWGSLIWFALIRAGIILRNR